MRLAAVDDLVFCAFVGEKFYMKKSVLAFALVSLIAVISIQSWAPPDPVVYIINLPRRLDRLERVMKHFDGVRPRIVPAIDGATIPQKSDSSLTMGELGCFMSHLKALQTIVLDRPLYAVLLEDDANLRFPYHFKVIKELIDQAPAGWGCISLGANSLPQRILNVSPALIEFDGFDLYGAHAVVYSRDGAKAYLEDALRSNITVPWDFWLSRSRASKLYVAYPPIANALDLSDSDTQKSDISKPSHMSTPQEFAKHLLPMAQEMKDGSFLVDFSGSSLELLLDLYDNLDNRMGLRPIKHAKFLLRILQVTTTWEDLLKQGPAVGMINRRIGSANMFFAGSHKDHGVYVIAVQVE